MPKDTLIQFSEQELRQIKQEAEDRRRSAPTPVDDFEATPEELAAQVGRSGSEKAAKDDAVVEGRTTDLSTLPQAGLPGSDRCPHCGDRTEVEGVLTADEVAAMVCEGGDEPTRAFSCGACGGEWGPKLTTVPPATDPKPKAQRRASGSSNGLKIESERETRNGVTRPSAGGKCRAVWDGLDAEGVDTTAKRARELADAAGWDRTTTMVQFYRWRKFNGVSGRQ